MPIYKMSWGAPAQNQRPPNNTQYGGTAPGYGAPPAGSAPQYGAPAPGAAPQGYGAPPRPGPPVAHYGAPGAAPQYRAPAPGAPAAHYGAPAPGAAPQGYGAPAPGAAPQGYGAPPQPGPPAGYGAPPPTAPGAPPARGYGAPPAPAASAPYGAPPQGQGYAPPGGYAPGQGYGGQPGGYGGYNPGQGVGGGRPPPAGVSPDIWQWFQAVDSDRSGQISAEELQRALMNGNWSPFNAETCRLMIGMFDKDKNGKIGPQEFSALWKYIQDWKACFDRFDTDRSGNINSSELGNAFSTFGYRLSPQFCALCVRMFDRASRQTMNFDDFIQCCVMLKSLTEQFRQKDAAQSGQIRIHYEEFLTMVLDNGMV